MWLSVFLFVSILISISADISTDSVQKACKSAAIKLLNTTNYKVNKSYICDELTNLVVVLRDVSVFYIQVPLMHIVLGLSIVFILISIFGNIKVSRFSFF
jgi:hypothetical protein